jgi:hypothetical protein
MKGERIQKRNEIFLGNEISSRILKKLIYCVPIKSIRNQLMEETHRIHLLMILDQLN